MALSDSAEAEDSSKKVVDSDFADKVENTPGVSYEPEESTKNSSSDGSFDSYGGGSSYNSGSSSYDSGSSYD